MPTMKQLSRIVIFGAIALCFHPSAQATVYTFAANLTGGAENPPVATSATGTTLVVYDDALHTLAIDIVFSGLIGATTASHIHAAAAFVGGNGPVAVGPGTLPGFPLGVMSGMYDVVMDLTLASSYTTAFVTNNGGTTAGAEAALFTYMQMGNSYLNVHTTSSPGGEIRGNLVLVPNPSAVPDTATTACLFSVALGVMGLAARRSRIAA